MSSFLLDHVRAFTYIKTTNEPTSADQDSYFSVVTLQRTPLLAAAEAGRLEAPWSTAGVKSLELFRFRFRWLKNFLLSLFLVAMASNLRAMASNLLAMASNPLAMAS